MKQVYNLFFTLIVLCYFSACQQKMICPAYHSYFILDVDETRNTFSMFGPDSLPKKNWEVEKEKYGIAKEVADAKKIREMRIISMNSIYKKIEDPFAEFQRMYAENDGEIQPVDSISILSASRGDNDFQNIDQMIYLHHFGKYLPSKNSNNDDFIRQDMQIEEEEEPLIQEEQEPEKKKKGLFGIFRKKDRSNQEEDQSSDEEQPKN
jgi:hypothetical protein